MTQTSFVDAENRFYLMPYDVINYTFDVISTADSYESVKDVRFTDVHIVENIVV